MMEDDNAALISRAAKALKADEKFPVVKLNEQLGRTVNLAILVASGPLLVTFYRGGCCPYRNLELSHWRPGTRSQRRRRTTSPSPCFLMIGAASPTRSASASSFPMRRRHISSGTTLVA
jgi:hypothetical protein